MIDAERQAKARALYEGLQDIMSELFARWQEEQTYEGGTYYYRHGVGYSAFCKWIILPQYGKTLAAFTEIVSLPCPKVRKGTETRWRCGEWQKYVSKRWIAA